MERQPRYVSGESQADILGLFAVGAMAAIWSARYNRRSFWNNGGNTVRRGLRKPHPRISQFRVYSATADLWRSSLTEEYPAVRQYGNAGCNGDVTAVETTGSRNRAALSYAGSEWRHSARRQIDDAFIFRPRNLCLPPNLGDPSLCPVHRGLLSWHRRRIGGAKNKKWTLPGAGIKEEAGGSTVGRAGKMNWRGTKNKSGRIPLG
ncbi:hypothetical protein KM043_016825 [Ampulex compressa]|nr:hypothetical protein KM043_016825 [Ampulex compressa]